jgi:putative drug exporter of the RND superfamily
LALIAFPAEERDVLQRFARLAIAAPRRIVAIALLVMIGAAIFGIPVAKSLSGGGFQDPTSESAHASALLAEKFDYTDTEMLITVSSDDGIQSEPVQAVGTDIVQQLKRSPYVADVKSPWDAPPQAGAELVSKDAKSAVIIAGIRGGENDALMHAKTLSNEIVHDREGVTVRAGGSVAVDAQINEQTEKDLLLVESIAIPLIFLVLVGVFGGLLAAALPIFVGGLAILGSMAVLRAITFVTDVSIFALNLTTAMGLALAIDYTLLILNRYRDELADGAPRDEALVRAMAATGRTVLFSAATVALSMIPMVLFPMYFLKSFAYAGVGVVAFAAIAAVVVTPALIALLGDRIDSLDIRRLARRVLRRPDPVSPEVPQALWYSSTKKVMRHAIPVGLAVLALLLVLGAPFLSVRWGSPDDRVLPRSAPAHQVGEALRTDFATNSATNVTVVIPDSTAVTPDELARYAGELSLVPDVSWVSSPVSTFAGGQQTGPPSGPTAMADGSAFLTVGSTAPLFSDTSKAQLDWLHAVAPPNGQVVQLTGAAQMNRDATTAITSRLPIVLTVIAVTTFLLLFLLTGSLVIPVKTLVLNVVSLTAAFGALVWIFQDGHLGALGTTTTGTLDTNMPMLLFCIAFGLSMDYEVFLISRIREYWLNSDQTRADNDESVALGLAQTGRVITAAAVIMSISFAALIAAQVSFMRMFGVGLTLAVLVDATLVRMMLVPAFMHVLGRVNWWAPKPLARLHTRFGFSESVSYGRHAAASPCGSGRDAQPAARLGSAASVIRGPHRYRPGGRPAVGVRDLNVGTRRHRRDTYRASYEPILDERDHVKVKALLPDPKRRTQSAAARTHLLTFGIGRCGVCEGVLGVAWKGPKGNKTSLYVCNDRGCVGRREKWVDELVVTTICERLSKPDALRISHTDGSKMDQARRVAELGARLDGAADAYAAGLIVTRQLTRITQQVRLALEAAERRPRPVPSNPAIVEDLIDADDTRAAWDELSVSQQRAVLEALRVEVVIKAAPGGPGFRPESVDVFWLPGHTRSVAHDPGVHHRQKRVSHFHSTTLDSRQPFPRRTFETRPPRRTNGV